MLKHRLLLILLLLPFIFNGPDYFNQNSPLKVNAVTFNTAVIEGEVIDERAQILAAYLSRYDSPLQYHAQHFIDAADRYQLDWTLVAAIAGTESTFGKHIPGGYNAWGWGVYGNQALGFQSWKDGIYTVSKGLRTNYYNKGLTNLSAINRVYASSNRWAFNVAFFMEDMERFKDQYKQDQLQKISSATSFLAQKN